MITEVIIRYVVIWLIVSGIILTLADIIISGIYDIKDVKLKAAHLKNPSSKQARWRPLISIIIPAHNEELVIERCLASIVKSSYRKFEIIIVDDKSSDKTSEVVKKFIKKHSKQKIFLVKKAKNVGRGGAINAGFKRHAKGELIMALDADCIILPDTLVNAVNHFAYEDITALASNVRIMQEPSIIALLQRIEWVSAFRSKKFNTVTNSEYIVGGSGAVYTRDIFKRLRGFNETMLTEDIALSLAIARLGNKRFKLAYGSDVVIYTEPVPNYLGLFKQRYRWKLGTLQALFAHRQIFFARGEGYSKFFTWYKMPVVLWGEFLLLIQPFLFVYFLYLGFVFHQTTLILIVWLGVTFMMLYAIWTEQYLPLKEKLNLSFYAPMMYILFNILMVIQVIAMVKCLWNHKKITGRAAMRGNWTPPKRIAS